MQTTGPRGNPNAGPSLLESLDAIKHGYEVLQAELNATRVQRDEYEAKVEAQVTEVNSMRQSLYELERKHNRACVQYEAELKRLQSELVTVRGGPPLAGPSGIQGRSPRLHGVTDAPQNFPSSSTAADSPHVGYPRRIPSRGSASHPHPYPPPIDRDRDPSAILPDRDFHPLKTTRDDSDRDREYDQRDPKRHKPLDPPVSDISSRHQPLPATGHPPVKPLSSLPSYNTSYRSEPVPGSSVPPAGAAGSSHLQPAALPPMGGRLPTPPEDRLAIYDVPSEYRKEGTGWDVLFNPQVKRALDVNLLHTFNHPTVVCCVSFSTDGRFVATGCNHTAQIFDVQSGAKICTVQDDTAPKTGDLYIRSVRFSPDGKFLATAAEDHKIRVWDIAKRRIVHVLEGHRQEIYDLEFSRDGRFLVSGSGDWTLRIWNMADQSCRTVDIADSNSSNHANGANRTDTLQVGDNGVTSVAISPDGTLVAAGCLDSFVRIWEMETGLLVERLRSHTDAVYSVSFTPDGMGLVSGSLDTKLKLWDLTGVVNEYRRKVDSPNNSMAVERPRIPITDFVGHQNFVLSVGVSNDSRWVVSGSKDRTVHFWDLRSGALQFILRGHKNSVIDLDINPLGGMLATGSGDFTARIWTYSAMLNI